MLHDRLSTISVEYSIGKFDSSIYFDKDDFVEALNQYADLGDIEGKKLVAYLPEDFLPNAPEYEGPFILMEHQNGRDYLFNAHLYVADPFIAEAMKKQFAGTEVEDFISAIEAYIHEQEKNRIETVSLKNDGRNPGNIESLKELNEVINTVVNFIVDYSTQHTMSGTRYMGYDDVSHLISKEDYDKYLKLIAYELEGREEVLELEIDNGELDVTYGLAYCPNYQWCEGDEAVFGMSEEEWEESYQFEPAAQPLSMSRMAEIADRAIPFILSQLDNGLEELQDSLGMTEEELSRMHILNDVPNLHSEKRTNPADQRERFEVSDPRSIVKNQYKTLGQALEAYEKIGTVEKKTLSVILPAEAAVNESVCLLQRENGCDLVTNLNDIPPVPQVYEAYMELEGLRSGNRLDAKIKVADIQSKQLKQAENKEKNMDKERE